jgi:hypothetical protein
MHRFIPESGATDLSLNPEYTAAIKRWTRETLALADEAVVSVMESPCRDEGCPLVETVIAVFDKNGTRTWRLTRPRAAVTKTMIRQTLGAPNG